MTHATHTRRHSHRVENVLPVRFRINDGDYINGKTENFTSLSLAVRSDAKVLSGDKATIELADLPVMEGIVIRVFPGGFAVRFGEAFINLVAHAFFADPENAHSLPTRSSHAHCLTPLFNLSGPDPAWGRFGTKPNANALMRRHALSLIVTNENSPEKLNSAWLEIGNNRWVARILGYAPRGKQAIALIHFNDWQMRLAATEGFTIFMHFENHIDWQFQSVSEPISTHMNTLERENQTRLTA